jgi:glycosyltransferase EpsJ
MRLAGMEAAKGDYLLSVDADDQISEDYLEQLLLASLRADADLAICDDLIYRDSDGTVLFTPHKVPRDRKYLLPLENVEYEYDRYNGQNKIIDQSYVVFWSKLYRRDLVHRALPWLRQEKLPIIYTEDVLYAGVFLRLAKRAVFTHQGTYYYTNNPHSAMRATFSERLGKITGDQLETLYFLNDFLTQTGADTQLQELYKTWKLGLWEFLELRYAHYRPFL